MSDPLFLRQARCQGGVAAPLRRPWRLTRCSIGRNRHGLRRGLLRRLKNQPRLTAARQFKYTPANNSLSMSAPCRSRFNYRHRNAGIAHQGRPGRREIFARAMANVSMTLCADKSSRPQARNSALMNFMSKSALCAIKGASPTKAGRPPPLAQTRVCLSKTPRSAHARPRLLSAYRARG